MLRKTSLRTVTWALSLNIRFQRCLTKAGVMQLRCTKVPHPTIRALHRFGYFAAKLDLQPIGIANILEV